MNGAATAQANVPYVSGQAIQFDGMSVTVQGAPANGDRFDATPSAPDLSVFDVLDRVAGELQTSGRSKAQVAQTVASGLRDIDATFGNLQLQRSMAGESLNRLDAVENRLAETQLDAQTERSLAEDLDMVRGAVGLPGQANRLRGRAEYLLAGAAHVAVRLSELSRR